jgi:hypothetical protein
MFLNYNFMILKNIGALSLGFIGAIFGFIVGLLNDIFTFTLLKSSVASQLIAQEQIAVLGQGYSWLITIPIFTALSGLIGGIIFAFIYNWIAVKITGGLRIELSEHSSNKK